MTGLNLGVIDEAITLLDQFADDVPKLIAEVGRLRMLFASAVTEHAIQMSGGGMHVRYTDPEVERIFPLDQWIPAHQRNGGHVWRRTVIVVEDWQEVPR